MEKLLVAAVMAFTLGIMVTVEADRCLCPVKHPQQKFCNSDFVFVATVRGAQEANGYLVYDLKVSHEKVFKGEEFVDRAQKYIKVFTSYNGLLCGRPNLVYLEKYLISGVMVDDHMEISYCDWLLNGRTSLHLS
ncbi:putative metalloproteinase inhibitor 1 [Apostichopus japonicus]|uniref:Putative metalloproteinase inhibitor 1 n=1 Tax=Stichopus japonicus TaxID=307972 RepID=A0A2G8L010_STIJA|nr:putative metalloproteinase inhibitor 1 [Apostichopus japonicus]